MRLRSFSRAIALALGLASLSAAASTQDATFCLLTAERVEAGETLDDAEKKEAHEACQRAIAATGSVVQKYQFQEADFAIAGTHR
jgi:hypothetical protein